MTGNKSRDTGWATCRTSQCTGGFKIAAADIVDDVRAIARQICWPRLRWNERAIRLLRITEQQSAASVVRQRNDRLGEFRFMHVIAEIEPFLDFK